MGGGGGGALYAPPPDGVILRPPSSARVNPRPDEVWRVTRPDGGWPKGPPSVSSKVRVVE